jgi:hypothetical protein
LDLGSRILDLGYKTITNEFVPDNVAVIMTIVGIILVGILKEIIGEIVFGVIVEAAQKVKRLFSASE